MLRNITLSADERLIDEARAVVRRQNHTLNDAFREWLRRLVGRDLSGAAYNAFMERLTYVRPGRAFSREELNAR